jgi:hypothetical protein
MQNWYRKAVKEYLEVPENQYYISDGPEQESPSITEEELEEFSREKWIPIHDSSFIDAIAYYEPLRKLEVKIHGKEYIHDDVPKRVFKNFMKAESKGKFYNDVIKGRYGRKK